MHFQLRNKRDVVCNLCGSREFEDVGNRVKARCTRCGSFERTRLLWLYFNEKPLKSGARVLHVAPEKGLSAAIKEVVGEENYVGADLDTERFGWLPQVRKIDLTNLDSWSTAEFDVIIHSHVLEHVPCTIAYTLYHLHRMLKPDGIHLMCVPFSPGFFREDFDPNADDRLTRYGQEDHVRQFGKEDAQLHLGAVVDLNSAPDATSLFDERTLEMFGIPRREYLGFTGSTVLALPRASYSLGVLPDGKTSQK